MSKTIVSSATGGGAAPRRLLNGALQAVAVLSAAIAAALVLGLNAAGAGLLLLVAVLLTASRESLPVATASAVAATLAFNFFFFPPKRTFVIDDPENWVAVATFLVTALVANRLLVRARRQAEIARASREDLQSLYELSIALLPAAIDTAGIGEAALRYLMRIGAESGGVILFGASPQQQKVLAWTGAPMTDEVEDIVAGVGRHGLVTEIPSPFGRDLCVPLRAGDRVRGALMARGRSGDRTSLESAANVLSFALDRERFMSERARLDALQQANDLKTSVLQAVAHDLKSPLTVLSVESEALERTGALQPASLAHVRTIRMEVGRLHRRIDNLLFVARLEAGIVSPHVEPTPPADLFRAARESLPAITRVRPIHTLVGDDTPDLLVDPSLALEIAVNLIENAHAASPPSSPIELSAALSPDAEGRVRLEIRDSGAGLPIDQMKRLRALDATDAGPGLGVELARTLAQLSGGSVEWFARLGGGTIARVDLPAAPAAVAESV